jgi:peptidoglycan/LPS O-acetylase OafA/YrhL
MMKASAASDARGNQRGTRYDSAQTLTLRPASHAQGSAAYTPALDGLRGIAIILVLFHHFTILRPETPFDRALANVPIIGWCGVDLFFVLSGFLITGILIDARGSDRYFSSFYARRTLRIFPLYYLVVFLSLVVLPQFPFWYDLLVGQAAPREQLPYWLYLTNFAVAGRDAFLNGVLDVAWSLAIEEQFYLFWAALVWLCPPRVFGPLCALLLIIVPVLRGLALGNGATPIDVYVLTPYRIDALATGALLAWLMRRGMLDGRAPQAQRLAGAGVIAIIGVCCIDGESWWWGPWMQRAGYSLLALTSGAMLVAAVMQPGERVWPRLLSAGWLRAFGKYSYCLYLIHLPVMRTMRAFVLGPEQFTTFGSVWAGQVVFYVVATVPAFALAWVSWRAFEAPILKLKARFPY